MMFTTYSPGLLAAMCRDGFGTARYDATQRNAQQYISLRCSESTLEELQLCAQHKYNIHHYIYIIHIVSACALVYSCVSRIPTPPGGRQRNTPGLFHIQDLLQV